MDRKAYPSDISDDEWAFVAPYLTLMTEEAPHRVHSLREVFNGLRRLVRAGAPWRIMPHDLPPRQAVYHQTRRWVNAGVFETIVHDLRVVLGLAEGRKGQASAAISGGRTPRRQVAHRQDDTGRLSGPTGEPERQGGMILADLTPPLVTLPWAGHARLSPEKRSPYHATFFV